MKCRGLAYSDYLCAFINDAGEIVETEQEHVAADHDGVIQRERDAAARAAQRGPDIPGFRWNGECWERIKGDDQIAKEMADDMRNWHANNRPGWTP